ncbi:sedoheptulose 7-phosphate cyclase [Tunicatimonas pelagia]|uniref:sedoheptulose 7-phosphate cyclase n=1 Tax=Tunicatimonas pelagia TaxID=931531 RepID=UPI0026651ADC|nr:sedoheptulose 7-phosphate cyclase [Tunicatimonas pelagia]WKN41858.1 sedoheptulose 7-phosphate cyclase [Tunicatimonas pelagia]
MSQITESIRAFLREIDPNQFTISSTEVKLEELLREDLFKNLLIDFTQTSAFSKELGDEFIAAGAIEGVSACRKLRSSLNLKLKEFFALLAEVALAFDQTKGKAWKAFSEGVYASREADTKLLDRLRASGESEFYTELAERLVEENPHAIYPTSNYRESKGYTVSTEDDQAVEAVMSCSTFTSIRITENALDPNNTLLVDKFLPKGRCVCLVDKNVEHYYGEQLTNYFAHHNIEFKKLVYRAMEVDKGINTVEQMLGDFKRVGVSRNEPVLIVGGGVIADTGGLACALYHRNTPYIMLSTSIVAGIDAGPSPRTCCDGFGYKNLFGAYHAPVLSITDRSFFSTLHKGWLRHGIAEIIKMAVVKDAKLFGYLEQVNTRLLDTSFGTVNCDEDDEINNFSQKILGAAMRSYVEAEYDNLYETHQCRPHAYGHTWSPGFEIKAGLLHGHAVAIGMGWGAYLSYRNDWIDEAALQRILTLISTFELSLWHDILLDEETLWAAQEKMIEKRGGNLVAPLPKGNVGQCGYLNQLTRDELRQAISEYHKVCQRFPRKGLGVEPLCSDVGLEDPSTVYSGPVIDQNTIEETII